MLKSKIHRAHITGVNLDYEGSIAIDRQLLRSADILPYEKVEVLDLHNGARFQTYAIEGGDGEVIVNGAAARLVAKGDTIIILSYIAIPEEEVRQFKPKLVFVDAHNRILESIHA
jgi:aspartate 1-decarboxylase